MLNIINNLPEALCPTDLPDCLAFLHMAHCHVGIRPHISFVCGYGGGMTCVGDDLDPNKRWWARRPRGDKQRMLPFSAYGRARVAGTYSGSDSYFEVNINRVEASDSYGRRCHRTLTFQPGETTDRSVLRAIRIHGLSSRQIETTLGQLGWL